MEVTTRCNVANSKYSPSRLFSYRVKEFNKMECKNEKHIVRDNSFGITWCIRCGHLFKKSVGRKISKEDRLKYKIFSNIE